ncbi:hypothetical protein LguiB_028386 [Lonicera macranthoides]
MDSPEETNEKENRRYVLTRCSFLLLFSLFALFSVSIGLVFVGILIGSSSITDPISVPSQCKIVSSTVDIRSSKVCELGLLNYKAKHVFYPSEKKKFRCRYDYYWASVFKVEYIDHSGQAQLALAEAPNEALPPDCRPTFGAAWLTKDEFKVNGTYDCWYTLGLSKVNLYQDGFFNCQATNPSTTEMFKRYSVLCSRMLMSWLARSRRASYWRWDLIAGVITGFSTSLISISLARLVQQAMCSIPRVYAIRLKRAFFLVAYFSFVGWFAIQYGKKLGLPELF